MCLRLSVLGFVLIALNYTNLADPQLDVTQPTSAKSSRPAVPTSTQPITPALAPSFTIWLMKMFAEPPVPRHNYR
jgi:hypothetical protein